MKTKNLTLSCILVAGALSLFIFSYFQHLFWIASVIHNEPLHSTFETIGALASIMMGILLLQRQALEDNYKMIWMITGLIVMGLLDGFHAIVTPGNNFVLLHSSSVFFGGLFFSFMWFSKIQKTAVFRNVKLWFTILGSFLFAIWVLLSPETVPRMLHDGKFKISRFYYYFVTRDNKLSKKCF